MVVVTFRLSNLSTLALGVEILTVKPGVAETMTAEAARATREARREKKSIATKAVRVAGGAT